jgi:hypothetical protein
MCAASPALTDLFGISCGPDAGALQSGHEQTCPTLSASSRFVVNEKSSSLTWIFLEQDQTLPRLSVSMSWRRWPRESQLHCNIRQGMAARVGRRAPLGRLRVAAKQELGDGYRGALGFADFASRLNRKGMSRLNE